MALRTEADMAEAVARRFKNSAREVRVGNCIFDVVAYDKQQKLFTVIECKLGGDVTSIGHAFGQISAYYAVLSALGRDFINAFTKKVPLRYERMMEATNENRQLRVAFSVALTQKACTRIELIRSVKHLLPAVGIVRVKPDGSCRDYLRLNGKKDLKVAKAVPAIVEIIRERSGAHDRMASQNGNS